VITPPTVRVSYIILTITLTVILISSPVIAVFSPSFLPPMALKVGLTSASATSSENNDDDNNEGRGGEESSTTTDAMTDEEEEEVVDDNGGDVQQEDNTEQQQQPLSSSTQEQEADDDEEGGGEAQQLATVVGEICDDFEDNDGDGLIDLADANCAAAPLTQGTITAPTTPPLPSVTNTTAATNSTNNTLTGSEITTRELTTPSTDDEASGITEEGNNVTTVDGRPVIDLEKECDSYEELGIPPPPLGFGQPPDAKWYHCPPGVGVWVTPNGTSSLDATGGGGEVGQQGLAQGGEVGQQGLAQGGEVGQQGLAQGGGVQAPPPTTTTTPQVGQIQQQLQQLCAAAQQQGTSPATVSPTTTTNSEDTGITSYLGGYIPSSTRTPSVQAPPTTTSQGAQIQQLCAALQQQIEQLPTSPDSSGGGTRSTTLPDGTVIVDNPNGSYVVTTPTGATITLSKPPEQPKDPNDLVTIDHPNGVSITWKRDGGEVAKYPGGIERITNPWGKSVIKYPGGMTIQYPDGSILNLPEGGKWTIIEPPPATDIGVRLNQMFFGSNADAGVKQYLPLDEFLWSLIPGGLSSMK
jgi:hypothetical protein